MSSTIPSPERKIRRRRLRVTWEGWCFFLTALALLTTGLFKGINLVTLLGCLMMGVWLLHFLASWRLLRKLVGSRQRPDTVFAGQAVILPVTLVNPRRQDMQGVVLEDRGIEHQASWFIPRLRGRTTVKYRQEITLYHRGRYCLGPLVASTRLPLGLIERQRVLAPPEEIVVLPALGQLRRERLQRLLARYMPNIGRARQRAHRHPAAQAELYGLREYRSGDSPRWIHWRTTARTGELMVREFEETPTNNLIVFIDTRLPANVPAILAAERLETAISLAATICWEWCRQTGDQLALVSSGLEPAVCTGTTGREHCFRLLRALAVLEATEQNDLALLRQQLGQADLPLSPVLVISAGPTDQVEFLQDYFRRRVALIAMTDPEGNDLFERTSAHAN